MHILAENLKTMILKSRLVNEEQFKAAEEEARRSEQSVIDVVIGTGLIPENYMSELLAEYFGAPLANLKKQKMEHKILQTIPEVYAKANRLALFDVAEGRAKVAMEDPWNLQTVKYLEQFLGMPVDVYYASSADLRNAYKLYKRDIAQEFTKIIEENIAQTAGMEKEGKELGKLAERIPIIHIVDSIIEYAIILNSSDVHFEILPDKLLVRYRIDGILRDVITMPKEIHLALIARIKILSGLQIDEHFKPQDGRFKFQMEEGSVDIRVSVMPTFYGEKSVLRLLKSGGRPLSLAELGIDDRSLKLVQENILKTHGMILVTGPTGHGKTTTLYAILHLLNKPGVNISTVEDPIEYSVSRINQTQVNVKAGITFATGLRSLLRQNPDILMVGEIRDLETAEISVHAALTGHLVLSTLHTNDAPTAIPRLIDLGVQPFLVSSTINAIVAQRLVRKICLSCVVSFPTPPEVGEIIKKQLEILGDSDKKIKIPSVIFKGKGCHLCNFSGYSGQIGIYEIFNVDAKVRELVGKEAVSIEEVKKAAKEQGMETMFEDGLHKVERGVTTIEEVLRVIRE